MGFTCGEWVRQGFGFANPNHAAAFACALLPFCWEWTRHRRLGRILSAALVTALLLTFSRTGAVVLALSWGAWLWVRRGEGTRRTWATVLATLAVAAVAVWWLWPRLALDAAVLNRPRIWLAGLRLFAANPSGVGLGNSGAVALAFLLPDGIPEVRTLVSSHLTLLVEFGRFAGWAWAAFVLSALSGFRRHPRTGIAFAGLVLSAGASTVFDWPVLFDFAGCGGLGRLNWFLSWLLLLVFLALGLRLLLSVATIRRAALASVLSALLVASALLVPHDGTPCVEGGYALAGEPPRTLVLHDGTRPLRSVRPPLGGRFAVPVRGVSRFPRDFGWTEVARVVLLGDCREWDYLVEEKGLPVSCPDD